ncbi:hypothetical protein NECAME_05920 [Necator americanus]|uniref:Uncharacterized protein n=1 Tax=Necator americanus TaxID=51031 RepID=W2TZL5_NECAM|nr:hypothetical protein NECAME_05920 [Necator americanus]ETN86516.1 hypothetical protein NECAME_05920 [Necator americanus]
MDCGLWCVFSERRRHVERLWRRRLLVTSDERRARRSCDKAVIPYLDLDIVDLQHLGSTGFIPRTLMLEREFSASFVVSGVISETYNKQHLVVICAHIFGTLRGWQFRVSESGSTCGYDLYVHRELN